MGKNFSMSSKVERNTNDFYQTPKTMTQHLLNSLKINKKDSIFEPSCGGGAIVNVLKENNYKNISYSDKYSVESPIDYIKCDIKQYDYVITNPPFKHALEFIEKSYLTARNKFFLLLPHDYLHGLERYKKNAFRGLERYDIFIRKPMLDNTVRDDGKYSTGMLAYAWFTFNSKPTKKEPVFGWFDNSRDIISSGKSKKEIYIEESQILMDLL